MIPFYYGSARAKSYGSYGSCYGSTTPLSTHLFTFFLLLFPPIFVLEPNENCIQIWSILIVWVFQICTEVPVIHFVKDSNWYGPDGRGYYFSGILSPSTKEGTFNKEPTFNVVCKEMGKLPAPSPFSKQNPFLKGNWKLIFMYLFPPVGESHVNILHGGLHLYISFFCRGVPLEKTNVLKLLPDPLFYWT